jgi:hypothetical protein
MNESHQILSPIPFQNPAKRETEEENNRLGGVLAFEILMIRQKERQLNPSRKTPIIC